jgi:hypothetical protein
MFKDWKTTLTGIVGAIAMIAQAIFKFEIPAEIQSAFIAVIVFLIGLFAKDSVETKTS